MAINESFLHSYEQLTEAVENAVEADTKGCLQNWLDEIDNEPTVAPMIQSSKKDSTLTNGGSRTLKQITRDKSCCGLAIPTRRSA